MWVCCGERGWNGVPGDSSEGREGAKADDLHCLSGHQVNKLLHPLQSKRYVCSILTGHMTPPTSRQSLVTLEPYFSILTFTKTQNTSIQHISQQLQNTDFSINTNNSHPFTRNREDKPYTLIRLNETVFQWQCSWSQCLQKINVSKDNLVYITVAQMTHGIFVDQKSRNDIMKPLATAPLASKTRRTCLTNIHSLSMTACLNQSIFYFNICSHQGDIRHTHKIYQNVNTECDLDKNIHPYSPIRLLCTNIIIHHYGSPSQSMKTSVTP